MPKPILSADSHITEPPDTYVDRIEPRYRDRAPHMVRHDTMGDLFVIDGPTSIVRRNLATGASSPVSSGGLFTDLSDVAVEWDGRTEAGKVAAAGVYFLRLKSESGSSHRKLLRLE